MDEIALVTPTSDRPGAFELCERWMARAIACYGRPVRWYVADDGLTPVRCTLGQTYIRRAPSNSSVSSFLGNLYALLEQTREEKILFIEDDDWYSDRYITDVAAWLDRADIVGEAHAKYYNVSLRKYRIMPNYAHASLCQTGIRRPLIKWLMKCLTTAETAYVDMELWKLGVASGSMWLEPNSQRCVGLKGLPGKVGISNGHRPPCLGADDPDGTVLREWIGPDDAGVYRDLLRADA